MTATIHGHTDLTESVGEPVSLSHLFRITHRYKPVILLTLAVVAIAYALIGLVVFLMAPVERVTSQQFRLDFEGAATGTFPNGLRFSTTDVVNPGVLLRVYRENELQRYASFPNFSRSIFVLESNPSLETLSAEYQARLSDPKLSPVDRERVQKEFEQKRDALAKNEYSLNYVRREGLKRIPEPIVRKALSDTLNAWADYAVKDQDVLAYRIAVLSPEVLNPTGLEKTDLMMGVQMLRSRTARLLDNVADLQKLPGAELARGGKDRMSLEEVRLRMEEIQRYEIEPLVSRVRASGTATPLTLRFMQDQVDYDQRQLAAARQRANALQQTLATYQQSAAPTPAATGASTPSTQPRRPESGGETVMPQISDTFLDRVADLVAKSADAQFRQKIVNDYRKAMEAVIPVEQTVAYETALLNDLKSGNAQGPHVEPAAVAADIETTRNELKVLVVRMNEIYREISRNVYSQSQLLTVTAPPTTRLVRAVDPKRLALWGVVVVLLVLPLSIVGALLHNRVREEEAEEEALAHSEAAT